MGPPRKSRSVNKRYSYVNEVSPTKDVDSAIKRTPKKRKLSDMLGPHWSKDELERFYEAYRKHGKDWKKVAAVVRNRTAEMVEAVYTMNRAYLSLPEGTASVAGFYAMMTDYYANMKDRDSDQESNDGAGTSRKPQKRNLVKAQAGTSKGSDGHIFSLSQAAASDFGCLSLLKKKRTGGGRPRAVGKRTPRFPIGYSYENANGEKFISPKSKGVKVRANANDDDVAHKIALALAEASQRDGSPQVSHTPYGRTDSVVSSPVQSAERTYGELEMTSSKYVGTGMYEDDKEGSMEADNVDYTRGKGYLKTNFGGLFHKGKGSYGKKLNVDGSRNNHFDDVREACSGTEEGQKMAVDRRKFDTEVNYAKASRSSSQGPKKRSKKVLYRRDEISALDALQTLADLSLMMPGATNEDESSALGKEENYDRVDESELPKAMPASRQREKRKSSAVTGKGNQSIPSFEIMQTKASKTSKTLALDDSAIPEAIQESYQSITKGSRKRQKISSRIAPKAEAHSDTNLNLSLEVEAREGGQTPIAKSKRSSQSASPQLMKHAEHSSSNDPRKEESVPMLSSVHVSGMNQVNLPMKVRSRRKMQRPQNLENMKFSDETVKDKPGVPFRSLNEKTLIIKEKLSNCLSNHQVRRWCAYEWFYSAIDYPWFAKTEFVEYLYHVGLGHVPRLTRVEWGVIRSSLGKPRRFSDHFLKEEKEKLNQYRDSVRTHYAELRSGTREGLPTDLARPLSVGQRVIAIYPKTREIHDGSVLTVDHSRCRVQFDRPELGVAFVKDIDCMPLNPLENMPTSLASQTISVDKFFESFNEPKSNGRSKDKRMDGHPKHPLCENVENADDPSRSSPSTYPLVDLLKQVAPVSADPQSKMGPMETATSLPTGLSQPSSQAQNHAKEADVQALAKLTRALDKKEAVVFELRRMNDDVFENKKDGDSGLKDSEPFKKQYAAVLVQLNEANAQVSDALHHLRKRNTYRGSIHQWSRSTGDVVDSGGDLRSLDRSVSNTEESECHVNDIVESSRTKASTMVDMALQALSSLKTSQHANIDETVDYVRDRLPLDDSFMPPVHGSLVPQEQLIFMQSPLQAPDIKSNSKKAPVPLELITRCVATLFMIQKCTERQFPPADVARILDSAVSSLEPCCSENLPMYAEVQKYMSIVKNQILALVPT